MATLTLNMVGDYTASGFSLFGSYSTYWQTMNSVSDSNYGQSDGSVPCLFACTIQTPTDGALNLVTAVTVNYRAEATSSKGETAPEFQVLTSGATTGLTNGTTGSTMTTSFANYNTSCSLTGASQTLAAWTGAVIYFYTEANNHAQNISELSVTITYTKFPPFIPSQVVQLNNRPLIFNGLPVVPCWHP